MSTPSRFAQARAVLERHGYQSAGLELIGEGAQSACYGTSEIAVLLSQVDGDGQVSDLTGHTIPDTPGAPTSNTYPVLQWLSNQAADAGVRTPRIRAVGHDPRPYALIERANGTLAGKNTNATPDDIAAWFGLLGAEVRKANSVETTGFGMFVPAGDGGAYRGRLPTWPGYLDRWLAVHLCAGTNPRPEDEKVLDLILAQRIVTERDLAAVEAKVREARTWPAKSVLTHYDNRMDNVVADGDAITMLDWGLALAGIGVEQELIKLFEVAPTDATDPRVAAFLDGYGLTHDEAKHAVEGGKLMLVLDGLGMSYGWAAQPDMLGGIRGWLQTIKRLSSAWR